MVPMTFVKGSSKLMVKKRIRVKGLLRFARNLCRSIHENTANTGLTNPNRKQPAVRAVKLKF